MSLFRSITLFALFTVTFFAQTPKITGKYGDLPPLFEENRGQVDSQAQYFLRGKNLDLFVTRKGATFALKGDHSAAALRMEVVDATGQGTVAGESPTGGQSNYFRGSDPTTWVSGARQYERVRIREVQPGVDLLCYANGKQFEYDLVVKPGARAERLRLRFSGAEKLSLTPDGDLKIETAAGELIQHRPSIWQAADDGKTEITGRYRILRDREVAVVLGKYDRSRELVIDPIISYSTFLGQVPENSIMPIVVDGSGNAYVMNQTSSASYPTTVGAYQVAENGASADLFITKLNATGTGIIYSTYLGGSGNDLPGSIALDPAGNIYVTGATSSPDFPITSGVYQATRKSNAFTSFEVFVTKLNPQGTGLVYSTYLGGSSSQSAAGIKVDSSGNAYIAGNTFSHDFPTTTGAYDRAFHGVQPCFLSKLNANGTGLIYSTYLGSNGTTEDMVYSIALDSANRVYLAGTTSEPSFPVTNGVYQASSPGNLYDSFISLVSADGSSLVASTYFGGQGGPTQITSMALDAFNNVYVTGDTYGTFPTTPGAFATSLPVTGSSHAFVTKLNPALTSLVYSTYLGGSGADYGDGIAVDAAGRAYVVGTSYSVNFPRSLYSFDPVNLGNDYLAFLAQVDPTGASLDYSTVFGGSARDIAAGVAVDSNLGVYVAGFTQSADFPVTPGAFQATNTGLGQQYVGDAFVTKIDLSSAVQCTVSVSPSSYAAPVNGGTSSFTISLPNGCPWSVATPYPNSITFNGPTHGFGTATISFNVASNAASANDLSEIIVISNSQALLVTQPGATCTEPIVSPPSVSLGSAGGTGQISFSGPASCIVSASASAPWITLTSGAAATSGNGIVSYSVDRDDFANRTANVLIGAAVVPVSQAGVGCSAAVSGNFGNSSAGGTGVISLTASAGTCAWQAYPSAPWLQLTATSGTGSASIGVTLSPNPGTAARSAQILIAGQTLVVNQAAGPVGTPSAYTISRLGGNGTSGFSGDGGPAILAQFNQPFGLAYDANGNLFVADSGNNRVRMIQVDGTISTVAGNGRTGENLDGGLATSAALFIPDQVAFGPTGNLYVHDFGAATIRELTNGVINTVASGVNVNAFAVDSARNLYYAINGNILKQTPGVSVTTVAGSQIVGFSGDGGPPLSAQISNSILGLIVDAGGAITFADSANERVRRVSGNLINTVAGNGVLGFNGDGVAISTELSGPSALTADPLGNILLLDPGNERIRRLTPSGNLVTIAGNGSAYFGIVGNGDGGPALGAAFEIMAGLAIDPFGNIAVSDTTNNVIRLLTPTYNFCAYSLTQYSTDQGAAAGSFNVGVTTGSGCAWNAFSSASWITFSVASGTGSGNAGLVFAPNTTGSTRTGTVNVAGNTFTVTQIVAGIPSINIETPGVNAMVSGIVVVTGWALESTDAVGPNAINSVYIVVDNVRAGTATYGISRPDVCAAYPGRLGCPNVGWTYNLNTSSLTPGSHVLTVTALDNSGSTSMVNRNFIVGAIPSIFVENPGPNASLTGIVSIGGWALENRSNIGPAAVNSVAVLVDGTPVGTATYGISRADVCAAFPGRLGCPNVGWAYNLNAGALSAGTHTLKVVATDTAGNSSFVSSTFTSTQPPLLPSVFIDAPAANATLTGVVPINGWAIENRDTVGPAAISSVTVFVDGNSVGTATYGTSRGDVCAVFPGRLGCPNIGWTYNLNVSAFTPGSHTLKIVATDTLNNSSFSQTTFTANTVAPSVYIEGLAPNANLSGTTVINGWAIENTGTVGPNAISSVTVYVDGAQVGTAAYGISRTDVCAAFPGRLGCPNVGWNYSLNTGSLAPGSHTLKVVATDSVGNSSFSQVNFTSSPQPFLTIEAPVNNATLTGSVQIYGWALENLSTVGPNAIASVTVFVDGSQVGTAFYGVGRRDVCAAFPGRVGCPNVGWSYSLNVNGFSLGAHTLKIVATDTAGNSTFAQTSFNANSVPPSLYTEAPANNATLSGAVEIVGWALENTGTVGPNAISTVTIFVDGGQVGTAFYGVGRADVCGAFPGRLGCPNVGWSYSLNVGALSPGSHTLRIVATDSTGNSASNQLTFLK